MGGRLGPARTSPMQMVADAEGTTKVARMTVSGAQPTLGAAAARGRGACS